MLVKPSIILALLWGLLAAHIIENRSLAPFSEVEAPPAVSDIPSPSSAKAPSAVITDEAVLPTSHHDILDIDNATTSTIPIATSSVAVILKGRALARRSGCTQGNCPDHNRPLDLLSWSLSSWTIRVNDCGACTTYASTSGGCARINTCGRPQDVCLDRYNGRMHRVYLDNGHKDCFRVTNWDAGNLWCGYGTGYLFTWQQQEKITCSW